MTFLYTRLGVDLADLTDAEGSRRVERGGRDQHGGKADQRMETGDERYFWVNQTMFIGEGKFAPGPRVEYRVYRLANS